MLEELLTSDTIASYIDFREILFLLAIGFIAKHFIKKLPNSIIPLLLMVLSIVYGILNIAEFNMVNIINAIVDSIINAAIAIGLHSSGKGLFKSVQAYKKVADSITSTESIFNNDNNE